MSAVEGELGRVVVVEVAAGHHAVRAAPVAERREVAFDEQVGPHVHDVDSDLRERGVRSRLVGDQRGNVRQDVVSFPARELLREVCCPRKGTPRDVPRHVRLVGEGDADG